jgi:hydroxymethylpyrimidine/phosphomethylpyrimidine kinase
MIAKGGASLLLDDAVDALKRLLVPGALVTPNAPEAERLTGIAVTNVEGQTHAGQALLRLGAHSALVKGGHIDGAVVRDVLVSANGVRVFESPRIETRSTHGTGCTLSSAIATGLAQGLALEPAVERARDYLMEAIKRAPGFGSGHGPLDHGWPLRV